ncbi:MAG: hypothetical protein Q7S59_10485 [Sulfurimonas sp.]|nr:hypothetical protein [Sulfurimonas sp.]
MRNITDEQIKQHIINVVKYEREYFVDKHLMNDYKSKILDGRNENEADYIAKKIISDMDRHLLNIEKTNFDINQIDLSSLIEYLKSNDFPFKEYLQEAILNKYDRTFGIWGDNADFIFGTNSFICRIVEKLHILNLVKQDERLNVARKRDAKRIKNAISTLLDYTNDKQVEYYLKTIKPQTRDITRSTVLSCIFYDLYTILAKMLPTLSKNTIQDKTQSIVNLIFSETVTDYRYYQNIEIIEYKGYKLSKFVKTKKLKNS